MNKHIQFPDDVSFSEDHIWVLFEDQTALIGLSDYGQSELGEIIYVELPETGDTIHQGSAYGTIEAMKTVIELIAPLSGEVIEVNTILESDPTKINSDPYNDGWMIRILVSDPSETEMLLTAREYQDNVVGNAI